MCAPPSSLGPPGRLWRLRHHPVTRVRHRSRGLQPVRCILNPHTPAAYVPTSALLCRGIVCPLCAHRCCTVHGGVPAHPTESHTQISTQRKLSVALTTTTLRASCLAHARHTACRTCSTAHGSESRTPNPQPTPVSDLQTLALKSVDYIFASEEEKRVLRERMRREMGLGAA